MFNFAPINILLIEDEEYDVLRVTNTLKPFNEKIKISDIVSNGRTALDLLSRNKDKYDIVIMDFQISGGLMGENLIKEIKKNDFSIQIIVITKMTLNITDYNFANNLLNAGAFWYCTKYPGDIEEYIYQPTDFILSIFNAYQKKLLEKEKNNSKRKLIKNIEYILESKKIFGISGPIMKIQEQIEKCASSNVNIIISGASGTGKELVATNIHYQSERKFENFVPINCGSLPPDLIESELFGYEKGAFTGANTKKLGLFEIANNGTLFLDEISELPFSAQVKLLRVIQEGEIEKIGRTSKIKVDVRIIAATNKNLEQEVNEKRFREDLFFRLNVIPINIPALKERPEDIPVLIDHFLRQFCLDMNIEVPVFEKESLDLLVNYEWRGNIRELKNIIQRLLFSEKKIITPEIVRTNLPNMSVKIDYNNDSKFNLLSDGKIVTLREKETEFRETYFKFVRNRSETDSDAAKKLGLAPSNYYRMSKELGLK